MTKKEKQQELEEISRLNDEDLKNKACRYMCAGIYSIESEIYHRKNKKRIKEDKKHQKYLKELAKIYYEAAKGRGIKIFKD